MLQRIGIIVILFFYPFDSALGQSDARVVARIKGQHTFARKAVQARIGQTVDLEVRLATKSGKLRPLPIYSKVEWFRIMPRMRHLHLPSRVQRLEIYSNSMMFGEDHGRWIGFDSIEYVSTILEEEEGVSMSGQRLEMSRADSSRFSGLGTAFISARVTLPEGHILTTPNEESLDPQGLQRRVMRISFRQNNTFLGWLSSFFNVPYIFGSTGSQTDRYLGTDCADVLVGARRASGHKRTQYTSVIGLSRLARTFSPVLYISKSGQIVTENEELYPLRWDRDIHSGDMIAMDYIDDPRGVMPRAWDHAAVLVRDVPSDPETEGILDSGDIIRHMTFSGLADQPLKRVGNIRFRLWRWR